MQRCLLFVDHEATAAASNAPIDSRKLQRQAPRVAAAELHFEARMVPITEDEIAVTLRARSVPASSTPTGLATARAVPIQTL